MKFWNFAPSETEPDNVALRIDGDIVDDEQAWLYEWLDLPCASPNAFRQELADYAGKNLTVTIDSYGGSVYAGTGIYNALLEHRANGGHDTTVGDTKVMSAATVIFMAGEDRKLAPGCVFMVHNPLTGVSGYASDLRHTADVLDEIKNAILNAYELGTGKDRKELSDIMDAETYMSAQTAIDKGFATGMLYTDVQNSAPHCVDFNHQRFVNFAAKDVSEMKRILVKSNKGDTKMDDKKVTVADLEAKYGDQVAEIRNAAIAGERARMSALDALDDGSEQVHKIVMHAKEAGQTAEDIQFFVDTAKEAAPAKEPVNAGQQFMDDLINDNVNSGVNDVKGGVVTDNGAQDEAERKAFIDKLNAQVGGRK